MGLVPIHCARLSLVDVSPGVDCLSQHQFIHLLRDCRVIAKANYSSQKATRKGIKSRQQSQARKLEKAKQPATTWQRRRALELREAGKKAKLGGGHFLRADADIAFMTEVRHGSMRFEDFLGALMKVAPKFYATSRR